MSASMDFVSLIGRSLASMRLGSHSNHDLGIEMEEISEDEIKLWDLVSDIFSGMVYSHGLKKEDIVALKRTSRPLYRLMNQEAIWNSLYLQNFSSSIKPSHLSSQEAFNRRTMNLSHGVCTSHILSRNCAGFACGEGKIAFFDFTIIVQDLVSGVKRIITTSFPLRKSTRLAISDRKLYALTSHDKNHERNYEKIRIQIWDLNSGQPLYDHDTPISHSDLDRIEVVNEKIILTSFLVNLSIVLHLNDQNRYVEKYYLQETNNISKDKPYFRASFASGDRLIFCSGFDESVVSIYDVESGDLLRYLIPVKKPLACHGFSLCGNQGIAVVQKNASEPHEYRYSELDQLVLFDLETGKITKEIELDGAVIKSNPFVVVDNCLFVHFKGKIKIFELETLKEREVWKFSSPFLSGSNSFSQLVSSSGKIFALYQGGALFAYDFMTEKHD